MSCKLLHLTVSCTIVKFLFSFYNTSITSVHNSDVVKCIIAAIATDMHTSITYHSQQFKFLHLLRFILSFSLLIPEKNSFQWSNVHKSRIWDSTSRPY